MLLLMIDGILFSLVAGPRREEPYHPSVQLHGPYTGYCCAKNAIGLSSASFNIFLDLIAHALRAQDCAA